MVNPPKPADTNTGDHAPGVSKTLEENAAHARDVQEAEVKKARDRKDSNGDS